MGHGMGAQKDIGLFMYAEKFVEAGMAVLAFDYRCGLQQCFAGLCYCRCVACRCLCACETLVEAGKAVLAFDCRCGLVIWSMQ